LVEVKVGVRGEVELKLVSVQVEVKLRVGSRL